MSFRDWLKKKIKRGTLVTYKVTHLEDDRRWGGKSLDTERTTYGFSTGFCTKYIGKKKKKPEYENKYEGDKAGFYEIIHPHL